MNIFKKINSIKLKINKWEDVSINDYVSIRDIISSSLLSDEQKNLSVLAILMKTTEDEIEDLKIGEISSLISQMGWIRKFDFPKNKRYTSLMVGKYKCKVMVNMAEWNIAQYIDFQQNWGTDSYGKLLACFLVPTGATYNHGYSIEELATEIEEHVSITDYNALCFFFLKTSLTLTRVLQVYLAWTLKRMKMKNKKNPQMVEQINLLKNQMMEVQKYLIG